MFIDPIKEELNSTKATIALVGSLLSGFYLIVGPFVSGTSNTVIFIKSINNMFSFFFSLNQL
jgi:hypothetical protein